MDGKQTKNTTANENRQEIKELVKSGKAFTFVGSAISKAYKDEKSGEYYVEAVSSSDQEDLVGDMFTSKALGIMKNGFIGKTAFMNHRTNVPDDVFGSIVATDLRKEGGMQLFVLKFIVEQENEPAMKTWRMLNAGRVQLGTSVTVLVNSAQPNPNRKGGIIIDDIEPIEVSIVGVPCNRESKTMTATATKALELSNLSIEAEEIPMKTELEKSAEEAAAAAATEAAPIEAAPEVPVEEVPVEEAPVETVEETVAEENPATEEKALMPRTTVAMERYKAMVQEVKESKVAKSKAEMPKVEAKGMFADRVEHPSFWDLFDILCDCYWTLLGQVWNLQYAGETDYSDIEAAWAECLAEFQAANIDSFNFWKIPSGDDTSKSISLSLDEAATIEATAQKIAGLIETAEDENAAAEFKQIGKSLFDIAVKSGIPMPEIKTDVEFDVTKTKEFTDMATRAETAEAKAKELEATLGEAQEDLEVTKAGLKAAVEATNAALRQPLHLSAGNN